MCRVCYVYRESVDGVIPESIRRRLALKVLSIGRRELAIRIRGVRAFFAGETPGGHEWNQQNLKNGFLDAASVRIYIYIELAGFYVDNVRE